MRFSVLDGWRGICALLVALLHFKAMGHYYSIPLVQNSHLFVDFFFVLSGFVVTHAYRDRLDGTKGLGTFVLRRFGRLWPLHAAMLALFVLAELAILMMGPWLGDAYPRPPFSESREPLAIVTNVFLLHSLGLHEDVTWNYPSWSISAEFYTYLVFAAMAVLSRRYLSVAAVSLAVFGALVVTLLSPVGINVMEDYGFFRCLYGFFVGHLVYGLFSRSRQRGRTRLAGAGVIEAASVLLVAVFATVGGEPTISLAAPLVFGMVVYIFAFESGPISRVLQTTPFNRLGAWSYSIYMVHAFVAFVIKNSVSLLEKVGGFTLSTPDPVGNRPDRLLYFGNEWLTDLAALAYLAIVVGLAALTYRYIELPGIRFFKERVENRRKVAAKLA